jgi:hypothetical protein
LGNEFAGFTFWPRGGAMKDLMCVGIVLVFFGITWLYVRACERP